MRYYTPSLKHALGDKVFDNYTEGFVQEMIRYFGDISSDCCREGVISIQGTEYCIIIYTNHI